MTVARVAALGADSTSNTIFSPILNNDFSVKDKPFTYFAGQITGVEGYVESIGAGLVAAISLDRRLQGKEKIEFTDTTVIGALGEYCARENADFQPMNANYGILRPVGEIRDKKLKKKIMAERSLAKIKEISEIINE